MLTEHGRGKRHPATELLQNQTFNPAPKPFSGISLIKRQTPEASKGARQACRRTACSATAARKSLPTWPGRAPHLPLYLRQLLKQLRK